MGHILVLQPGFELGGIVTRLVAGRHTVVTARTSVRDGGPPSEPGVHYDAMVCAMPDARAAYEAFSRAGNPDAHKMIFVVPAESAPAIEHLPNPRLVKPFLLSELAAAIEAMMAGSEGKPPQP